MVAKPNVVFVDKNDVVIGAGARNDQDNSTIVRVAGVWLFNSMNELLIAQRSFTKVYDPGKWGPSAAGTVEEGETYESTAVREIGEELGIEVSEADLIKGKHRFVETQHNYFAQGFFVKCDLSVERFSIQKEEVEAIRWIDIDELLVWVTRAPDDFIKSMTKKDSNLYEGIEFIKARQK